MINLDKIINNVQPQIIETINTLAKEGNKEQLEIWLKECQQEIEFRNYNCYELQLEKEYLKYILSN